MFKILIFLNSLGDNKEPKRRTKKTPKKSDMISKPQNIASAQLGLESATLGQRSGAGSLSDWQREDCPTDRN